MIISCLMKRTINGGTGYIALPSECIRPECEAPIPLRANVIIVHPQANLNHICSNPEGTGTSGSRLLSEYTKSAAFAGGI